MKSESNKTKNKEPWLAVNYSLLFPGIGHFYADYPFRGLFFITLTIILLIYLWLWLINNNTNAIVLLMAIFGLIIPIIAHVDAYKITVKNNSSDFESNRKSNKDPWLAVFWSRINPSFGFFYTSKYFIAIVLLILSFIPILNIFLLILSPFILYYLFISTTNNKNNKKTIILVSILSVLSIILSLILSLILSFIVEARYIPGSSMEPTLKINDRLIVNKLVYNFNEPQRGDIVVFNATEKLIQEGFEEAYIKRIIALPGEKVEIKNGKVYINDQLLQENYIKEEPNYHYGEITVPLNNYFVLGDNRNNSYDSHYWGFVPRENLIGKATKIFYPPERIQQIK